MRELNHLFGLSSRTRGRPMISYARRGLNQTTGVVEATWGIRSSPFSRYMGSSLLGLAAPDLTVRTIHAAFGKVRAVEEVGAKTGAAKDPRQGDPVVERSADLFVAAGDGVGIAPRDKELSASRGE